MSGYYFVISEVAGLIILNILILRLYKKIKVGEKGGQMTDLNSPTLFNSFYPGNWMLRLPFPVFPDKQDDRIRNLTAKHNRLVYLYYAILVFALWHYSVFE